VRVVVAEDQLLTREGIVRLLQDAGIEVVGEALDVDTLMDLVRHQHPDVALVDIRLPPTHTDEGLLATSRIRVEEPGCGVLIVSQHVDLEFIRPLLEEGAEHIGYLLKDRILDANALVDALRRVHAGDCVIDPAIVQQLLARRRRINPIDTLSEREYDVLGSIAEGLSNQAIGERLFISERTVEVHTKQIFNKLGLVATTTRNRRVLAALAYLDGTANRHMPRQ
jgi:DNA-binding NarL/FixJ family response regulator